MKNSTILLKQLTKQQGEAMFNTKKRVRDNNLALALISRVGEATASKGNVGDWTVSSCFDRRTLFPQAARSAADDSVSVRSKNDSIARAGIS